MEQKELNIVKQEVKNTYASQERLREVDEMKKEKLREVTPATQNNQGQRLREEEKKEEK